MRTSCIMHKMKTTTTILLLLLGCRAASSPSSSYHPGDKAALLAVKAALGNPNQLASWTPDSSCCDDWHHVDCDDASSTSGRVTGLSVFQDASLTGTIPDAIAGLDHLESLDLRRLPSLSGPIPAAIAELSKLSFLTISSTAVSGPVPAFLAELTALNDLDLSHNALSGSIPASLAALPNLVSVNLRHNRLTGPVPPLLFNEASSSPRRDDDNDDEEACYYLRLSHNNLSGSLPAEWSNVRFGMVFLSRNAFTGDASALFGREKPLQLLDLSRNGFSFNLSAVELPERLSFMDVSHNATYGGIPAQVAELTDRQVFNVSYNKLCGEVPSSMASFDAYCFQHNSCLCGAPLAACLRPLVN